jgi:hypothetical protein
LWESDEMTEANRIPNSYELGPRKKEVQYKDVLTEGVLMGPE